jgi:hypothetical protein
MQRAEIVVRSRLVESEFVDEPRVIKDWGIAVRVRRRTKFAVGCAGRATGHTVGIGGPGPAYSVPYTDVYHIRIKGEFIAYGTHSHVESLATDIPFRAQSLASVLIDDLNPVDFRRVVVARSIAGHNWRQTSDYQQRCYAKSLTGDLV